MCFHNCPIFTNMDALHTLCQSRVPALGKLASIVYAYPYKPAFTIPPLGCPVIQPRSIPVVTFYFLNNLNIYSIILYKITWGFSGEVGELANYGYPHLSVHLLACQWEEKVAVVWSCNISSMVCVLSALGGGGVGRSAHRAMKPAKTTTLGHCSAIRPVAPQAAVFNSNRPDKRPPHNELNS